MSDAEKLSMIRAMCQHPGSFHWTGQDMARAITRIIDQPIPYRLSVVDEPIPYTLS